MKYKITKSEIKDKNYVRNKLFEYDNEFVSFTQDKKLININYVIRDDKINIIAGINSILYFWNCLYIEFYGLKRIIEN